jgi:ABC-type uncharacterized transport system permease subunit
MGRRLGIYLDLGLLIGAIFSVALGTGSDSPLLGIGLGALLGVFAGWFAYAAAVEIWKER